MTTLAGVRPDLAAAETRLRTLATAHGLAYTFADFGGVRSQADTSLILGYRDADYAVYVRNGGTMSKQAWRPISPFGQSMHNYGAAFDVVMVRGSLAQLGALAASAGLRWGGTFSKPDAPHFELPISLSDARAAWTATGNTPGVVKGSTLAALGLVAVAAGVLLWR